jgi:outer membrane protein OmpA-like peptidoglycan-associated protein
MKGIKKYIYVTTLLLSSQFMMAQNQSTADELYQSKAYNEAAQLYSNLLSKGYDSQDIHRRLADAFYFNSQYVNAVPHFESYINKSTSVAAIYYLRYAKSLEAAGLDTKAAHYYDKFSDTPNASEIATYSDYFNEVPLIESEPTLNTNLSEYPALVNNQSLYFISNRNIEKQGDQWSGKNLYTLYRKSLNEAYEEEIVFPRLSVYHEGSVAIDPSGQRLYLTLGGNGTTSSEDETVEILKIHQFNKKGKRWIHQGALPFNGEGFNTAHPALNSDGTKMYFSSDRPGGFGSSDIYVVSIDSEGNFAEPRNLGASVNTIGRESFPQVTPLDQLIFSSDGHKGYGGFDLFGIDVDAAQPVLVNLGSNYNSNQDDFSLIYCEPSHGFLASNRAGESSDDIYVFKHDKTLDFTPKGQIVGRVVYQGTPLSEVELNLNNLEADPISNHSSEDGQFKFDFSSASKLVLALDKEGYESQEIELSSKPFGIVDLGDIELKKSIESLSVGDDLAKFFEIEMIHFDFDKWNIAKESAEDLAKIAEVLIQYPDLKIEIRSHTDPIGTAAYNQILSDKRAKSTYDYLIGLGAKASQMTYKGYGESQLLNQCNSCSKEENRKNRRSEFIIVK